MDGGDALGCGSQELCNDGLDNDCDELSDEGCVCSKDAEQPCYDGPKSHAGIGACELGVQHCATESEFSTWMQCSGAQLPVAEICDNELDDDCDGKADEGCVCTPPEARACYSASNRTRDIGACRDGVLTCELIEGDGAWADECEDDVTPATERCGNDIDEDCDGDLDNGCVCDEGENEACYTGPSATRGVGACRDGTITCELNDGVAEWSKECEDALTPTTELCGNAVDEDCDSELDNGCLCEADETQPCYTGSTATRGVGACHDGVETCEIHAGVAEWGTQCDGDLTPATELCGNAVDEDCDGNLDNGCICDVGETQACYPGASETRGVGPCHDGVVHCELHDGVTGWTEQCENAVTPAAEICGNAVDEDCDARLDNGCAEIACPADMTVLAGDPLSFAVTGQQLSNYTFAIATGPDGGASTAVWVGIDPSLPSATLTPYIVGTYQISVGAEDPDGGVHSCSFNVTALPHGLRVQLSWDGTGDVDLHLHNNNASPWFNGADDCFYSSRISTWGAELDFDNIPGPGPENITVDNPVIGTTYVIGVHNYANAAGRIATVEAFCGDTASTTPQQTWLSHPLVGVAAGNCTENDFWHVARITFTSPSTCVIDEIDDYVTSATACTTL